ncbi:hypothetical protein IAQ61_005228 [Plenodomus lingam]|nr:hypothetical protein IAQ61_005228 [Plenodomus lingam]
MIIIFGQGRTQSVKLQLQATTNPDGHGVPFPRADCVTATRVYTREIKSSVYAPRSRKHQQAIAKFDTVPSAIHKAPHPSINADQIVLLHLLISERRGSLMFTISPGAANRERALGADGSVCL